MNKLKNFILAATLLLPLLNSSLANDWVTYEGTEGPGKGKHIVFVTGDEEYRSEEGLPMLAKILAVRHGFKCTVLFALNPADGTIDPNNSTNIVGLQNLKDADMMVLLTRFREPPDDQMKYIVDFVNAGKPFIALRTATHAFAFKNKSSPYANWDWQSKSPSGGFGRQFVGDTWVNHYGHHGKESTRGILNPEMNSNPILKGVRDIWGPTDVYEAHLPKDAQVLFYGQILEGMKPTDNAVEDARNNPMMPLIWIRNYKQENGTVSRILGSTIGSAPDLQCEDLRRLLVNACYWGMKMEDKIPARANVDYVGEYHPTFFGFGGFKKGMKPSDFDLK